LRAAARPLVTTGESVARNNGVGVGEKSESRADLLVELETLREADSRLRRITEHASDLLAEVDRRGRLLFLSPNAESVVGYPAADFAGMALSDTPIMHNVHPDDLGRFQSFHPFDRSPHARAVQLFRYRHADGSWRWFESRWQPFESDAGEQRAIVVARDVTEREKAVRALRQSEERYRVVSETTSDLVVELDAEGRLLFASASIEQVLGYSAEELVGTTPFNLLHPEEVEPLTERFIQRLGASGRSGKGAVFRVRHRDGSWRWLRGGGVNFETADGETHVVAVMSDVTEALRREAERSKLEDRVQETQKLESLGVMAGGVAHDFNNLLTPILGEASLSLMELPADSAVRRRIERIQRAAHHASTLTNQLLDYAGIGTLDAEPVDLSKLVREMGELLQTAVSKQAVLSYDLAADLPAARGDPRLLSQVVVNLLTNASEAVDARPGGGQINVRNGTQLLDGARRAGLVLGEEAADGEYVYFEVEDAGCGMTAETRARIFDPFFTTKFTGRGLGLAAVLGIVRKHGGSIEIDSEIDRGTRIRVLCPIAASLEADGLPPRPGAEDLRAGGLVLVADDDDGAREIQQEILTRAGFQVLTARDGGEAVECFRAHADSIRLVLLDRTMPGISGEESLDAIRGISAQVPIVLVSGYSRETAPARLEEDALCAFLQKPFLPETLLGKVAELLAI